MFKSYIQEFQFDVDDVSFLLKATRFTGNEKVYLNGNLISQKRNFMKDKHHIINYDGKNFSVKMEDKHDKGTSCSLFEEEIELQKYVVTNSMPMLINFIRLLTLLLFIVVSAPFINSRAIGIEWFIFGLSTLILINNQIVLRYEHIEILNA